MENTNLTVTVPEAKKNYKLMKVDVDQIDLLDSATELPVNLMSDYWTPTVIGEFKRIITDGIEVDQVVDQRTGEAMEMECAFFYAKEDGQIKRFRNASKRLVAGLSAIPRGSGLVIRYLGKIKNKNNANMSDNWSINPLAYEPQP